MTELAQREALGALTRDQVDLVKKTVAQGASDNELALFLHQANRTGLDPLSNQIYFIKRGDKGTIQIAIGGARLIAERTGRYRPGHTYWYDEDGNATEVWLDSTKPPAAARVTVFKDGHEAPGRAVTYKERVQNTPTWKSMPATMLAKCAEMDTLRTAFPQELSGLYSPDEMGNEPPVSTPRRQITEAPAPIGGITKAQVKKVDEALDSLVATGDVEREALDARLQERYGTSDTTQLTKGQADELLTRLEGQS